MTFIKDPAHFQDYVLDVFLKGLENHPKFKEYMSIEKMLALFFSKKNAKEYMNTPETSIISMLLEGRRGYLYYSIDEFKEMIIQKWLPSHEVLKKEDCSHQDLSTFNDELINLFHEIWSFFGE